MVYKTFEELVNDRTGNTGKTFDDFLQERGAGLSKTTSDNQSVSKVTMQPPTIPNIADETFDAVNSGLKYNPPPEDATSIFRDSERNHKPSIDFKSIPTPNMGSGSLMSMKDYESSLSAPDLELRKSRQFAGNVSDFVKTALYQFGLTATKPIDKLTTYVASYGNAQSKTPEDRQEYDDNLLGKQLGKGPNWKSSESELSTQVAKGVGNLAGDLAGLAASSLITKNPIVGAGLWGGLSAYGNNASQLDIEKSAVSSAAFMAVAGPVTKLFEGVGLNLLKKTPDALKNSLVAEVANKFVSGGVGGGVGSFVGSQVADIGTLPSSDEILHGAAMNAFFHGMPGAIQSYKQSKATKSNLFDSTNEFYNNMNEMNKAAQSAENIKTKAAIYREMVRDIENSKAALSENRYVGSNKEVQNLKQVLDYGKSNINDMLNRWDSLKNEPSLGSESKAREGNYSAELMKSLSEGERNLPNQEEGLYNDIFKKYNSPEIENFINEYQPSQSNTSRYLPDAKTMLPNSRQNMFESMVNDLPMRAPTPPTQITQQEGTDGIYNNQDVAKAMRNFEPSERVNIYNDTGINKAMQGFQPKPYESVYNNPRVIEAMKNFQPPTTNVSQEPNVSEAVERAKDTVLENVSSKKDAKFKGGIIEISIKDSDYNEIKKSVPADIYKGLAVHRREEASSYMVSHASSGVAIQEFNKITQAKQFTKGLADAMDMNVPVEKVNEYFENPDFKSFFTELRNWYTSGKDKKKSTSGKAKTVEEISIEVASENLSKLERGEINAPDIISKLEYTNYKGTVSGFDIDQREQLVESLIEGMDSGKDATTVDVRRNGTVTIKNDAESIARIMTYLKVKIKDDAEDLTPKYNPLSKSEPTVNTLFSESKPKTNPPEVKKEEPAPKEKPVTKTNFKEEIYSSHSGQTNLNLTAYIGGKRVGNLDYSVYKNDPYINLIEVPKEFGRKGIATALLQELQIKFPDQEIQWGTMTSDGYALKEKVTYKTANKELKSKFEELESTRKKLKELEAKLDNGKATEEDGELWNKLHGEEYDLQEELRNKNLDKTLIKMPKIKEPTPKEELVPKENIIELFHGTGNDKLSTLKSGTWFSPSREFADKFAKGRSKDKKSIATTYASKVDIGKLKLADISKFGIDDHVTPSELSEEIGVGVDELMEAYRKDEVGQYFTDSPTALRYITEMPSFTELLESKGFGGLKAKEGMNSPTDYTPTYKLFNEIKTERSDVQEKPEPKQEESKPEPTETRETSPSKRVYNFLLDVNRGTPLEFEAFKREVEFILSSKEEIESDLNKLTIKELKTKINSFRMYGLERKSEYVEGIYNGYIEATYFASTGERSYRGLESLKNQVLEALDELTPGKLTEIQGKYKKERESSIEDMKKRVEGFKSPKTLEDFQEKKRIAKLSKEEQLTYDELYSLSKKEKAIASKVSRNVLPSETVGNFNVSEDVDTRDNSKLWVIKLSDKVSREEFDKVSRSLRQYKINYSRFKGGFISKNDPSSILETLAGVEPSEKSQEVDTPNNQATSSSDSLRVLADNLQSKIDQKNAPRLANTARRAGMAANAQDQAEGMQKLQKTLRNIADAMDAGQLKLIDGIDSVAQIQTLNSVIVRAKYDYANENIDKETRNNYDQYQEARRNISDTDAIPYAKIPGEKVYKEQLLRIVKEIESKAGFKLISNRFKKLADNAKENEQIDLKDYEDDLSKIKKQTKALSAWSMDDHLSEKSRLERMGIESPEELRAYLREYVKYKGDIETKVDKKVQKMERDLIGRKFEGYFPTPKPLVEKMLEYADIREGDKVLEPSAGKGSIADMVKEKNPDIKIDVIEIQPALREVLEAKGYNLVERDFLQHNETYDKIVMNPPFENLQDVDHVQHAYDLLNPNGRVVSIMSEAPFFRSDKKAVAFREWLDKIGGESERLPEGSFKSSDRSTGVNTRLVTISKEAMSKTKASELDKELPDTIEELEEVVSKMEGGDDVLLPINLQLFAAAKEKLSKLKELELLKKKKIELISEAKALDLENDFVASGKIYEKLLDVDKQIFKTMKQLNREVPNSARFIRKIDSMKNGFAKKLSGQKYIDTWRLILQKKDAKDLLNTKLSEQKESYQSKLANVRADSKAKFDNMKAEAKEKFNNAQEESKSKQEDMKKEFKYKLKKHSYDIKQRYKIAKERAEYAEWWREKTTTEHQDYVSWWGEQLKIREAEIKKERDKIYSKLKKIKSNMGEMRPEYKSLVESILNDMDLGVKKGRSKKTISKLEKLRDYVQQNPNNSIPEDVLAKLSLLSKKPFGNFTIEELRTIYRTIAHFVHLNQLKNKLIIGRKIYDMEKDLAQMIFNIKKRTPKIKEVGAVLDAKISSEYEKMNNSARLKDLFNLGHYNPEMLSQVLDHSENGPIKKYFYDAINDAVNKKIVFEDAARKHFRDGLSSIDEKWDEFSEIFSRKISNVKYEEIKLPSNRTIKITKGQRVSLYLHSLSADNMRHIILGGIRLPKKTGFDPYKLSLKDFDAIISTVTPNELKIAKLVSQYFDTMSKDAINEVSVDLYGYELADVKNYFPINSDASYLERNLIKPKTSYMKDIIENFGFTKARTKGSNPILLRDVFDVVLDSVDKVGTYVGFAAPVRNARYILSKVEFKNSMIRHFGNSYLNYLEDYIDDIESIDYVQSPILDSFRRNTDTALLALNPWVIAKQPISYVMAATEIDSKYLISAITKAPNYDEINEHSPQLRRRLEGDISPEMGELGEYNKPGTFFLDRKKPIKQRLTDGILAADKLIIGRMWEAVKLEIKDKFPLLTGKEFFQMVAERTEELVRRTNSVFEAKDRTAIGRSTNEVLRTFIRFSSQRFVVLNSMKRALLRYSIDKDKAKLIKSFAILAVVSSLLLQSINTFRDWLYGRDTNSAGEWVANIAMDQAALFAGVGEILNTVKYALKTNRSAEVSAPSLDVISDLIGAIKDTIVTVDQFIGNEKYKTSNKTSGIRKGDTKWEGTFGKALDGTISVLARLHGLPYGTIRSMLKGLYEKVTQKEKKK